MTEPKNNCLICGQELVYKESLELKECHYCGGDFESQAVCMDRNITSWYRLFSWPAATTSSVSGTSSKKNWHRRRRDPGKQPDDFQA